MAKIERVQSSVHCNDQVCYYNQCSPSQLTKMTRIPKCLALAVLGLELTSFRSRHHILLKILCRPFIAHRPVPEGID